ncbi:MAG: hypothetical protein WBP26_01240 [Candidatus Saccharimonadales bacterium]
MSEHRYSCDTSSMRNQRIPIRGIPDVLNPDYSRPQPREQTVAWSGLGTALFLTGVLVAGCDSRSDVPTTPGQLDAPVVQTIPQSPQAESWLDALGPVALNG